MYIYIIHIYIIVLYTLNIHNHTCQLFLNKIGIKKKESLELKIRILLI